MEKHEYATIIKHLRGTLSDAPTDGTAFRRTRAGAGRTWVNICDGISFLYQDADLYIDAVRVGNIGYGFKGTSNFIIAEGTVKFLSHGGDYKSLGWDRLGSITVTLENVTYALQAVQFMNSNKAPDKTSLLRLVIAFAEGIRFNGVALNIVKGEAIDPKDISWDARNDTRVLRHDA